MQELENPKVGSKVLLTVACLTILVAGLRAAESIVVPFMLSVFLSMLAIPITGWLKKHRCPQPLAIVTVMLGMVIILVAIGLLVGGSVNAFTQMLPQYQSRLTEIMHSTDRQLSTRGIETSLSAIADLVNPGQIFQLAGTLLSRLAGLVSNLFLVILTTVFILTEAAGFPTKMTAAFGNIGAGTQQLSRVMTQVHRYLVIKTAISLTTGVLLGFWVWLMGVDFPFLWGLLAFLLNYIPNIGSIMASIPPVLLGLIQPGGGVGVAVTVALAYFAVNILLGNVIEPRLMGQRLGLSTLVVFLSLVFWGWVWGGVGMLLSVPLTMVVKILLQSNKEWRWVAVLLDKSPRPSAMI